MEEEKKIDSDKVGIPKIFGYLLVGSLSLFGAFILGHSDREEIIKKELFGYTGTFAKSRYINNDPHKDLEIRTSIGTYYLYGTEDNEFRTTEFFLREKENKIYAQYDSLLNNLELEKKVNYDKMIKLISERDSLLKTISSKDSQIK